MMSFWTKFGKLFKKDSVNLIDTGNDDYKSSSIPSDKVFKSINKKQKTIENKIEKLDKEVRFFGTGFINGKQTNIKGYDYYNENERTVDILPIDNEKGKGYFEIEVEPGWYTFEFYVDGRRYFTKPVHAGDSSSEYVLELIPAEPDEDNFPFSKGPVSIFGDSDIALNKNCKSSFESFLNDDEKLDRWFGSNVINFSESNTAIGRVGGNTGLKYGVGQVEYGMSRNPEAPVCILRFGRNDIHHYLWKKKAEDINNFKNNYIQAVNIIKDSGSIPILCEIHYEKGVDPLGRSYNSTVDLANKIIAGIAKKERIPLVKNSIDCSSDTGLCYNDFVLDKEGYNILTKNIVETIEKFFNI